MNTRLNWINIFAALTLAIMLIVTGVNTASAYVWTDQQDYSPGDKVTIHGDNSDGAGYQAGETVHVVVNGPNGYTAACDGIADSNGAWSCQVMLWPDYMAVGTYFYTATGVTSGVSQNGVFTDGNLKFHENGLPNGTSWTVDWNEGSQTVTAPTDITFGGQELTAAYSVTSPLSGGTGVRFVASPASGTATRPGNGSTTVDIAFTTQYQVSFAVNPSGGGLTSPSVTAYYDAGSTVSLSATPEAGYVFSSWSASTSSITFASASSASTNATVNGAGTITANFNPADSTPPTSSITLGPGSPNGNNGWYFSNVHVTVSAADNAGGSGVAETRCVLDPASAPATFDAIPAGCAYTAGADVTTDGQHIIYAASKDNAGNKETPQSSSFKIDKTAPTNVSGAPNRAADHNGWYNHAVDVVFTGNDATSGIASCTTVNYSTPDGAGRTVEGTCTDKAGNTSAAVASSAFKYDATKPTISAAATTAPNAAGWYKGDVTVHFTCEDALSGIPVNTCPADQVLTDEGAAVASTAQTVMDAAGNTSDPSNVVTVKIDKTKPTITWSGGPADGGSYYFGFVPAAPTCTAADALSGPNGCTVTGYDATVGPHTMMATAYDKADNSKVETRSYTVIAWTLKGFYQPVDMGNVWNTVKNGSTVPLKFEVFAGTTELTDVSAVKSLASKQVTCTALPGAVEDAIETLANTGSTVLRYDSTGGQFIFNWKTPSTPTKCYQVTMTAQDGSSITAFFKLK